ncbi:MAG: hypothetical protein AVDCRST_MAG93-9957, partial [uncultured Chloroflexia bacterium]
RAAFSAVPVVGVCLVEDYDGAQVAEANRVLERLIASREMAVVPIDTRLDENAVGLRTAAEIESLIARLDVMLTTRLHGTVLALKHGVPAIVIDPEVGGAKLLRQGQTIGWPFVFPINAVSDDALQSALAYCLSDEGRAAACACSERALKILEHVHHDFVAAMTDPDQLEQAFQARRASDSPAVSWPTGRDQATLRSHATSAYGLRGRLRRARSRVGKLLGRKRREP